MVDVSGKAVTAREAVAEGFVAMRPETLALIQEGGLPKGDVLAVARVAGIQAAKRTSELIPMCHPLPISGVAIALDSVDGERLRVEATVRTEGRTGVEMEALTAVSVAALTVYDMCKAVDRGCGSRACACWRSGAARAGSGWRRRRALWTCGTTP